MGFLARVYVAAPGGQVDLVSPDHGTFYQATIRPDSDAVIFYGGRRGMPRLWRRDLLTGQLDPLTEDGSGARHGVFSPDGRSVAFVSDRASPTPGERLEELHASTRQVREDVHLHLYVATEDGSEVRQITDGPHRDLRPAFTPDGRSLVFASDRRPGPTLWSVDIDPPSRPRPIPHQSWAYRPWCTPDGTSVVFYGPDGGRHRLFRLDRSREVAEPVSADDRGDTHGPFVDGDGNRILAHSTRGGDWGLWEFPLTGDEPPREVTPRGFPEASHPTRSSDGTIAFDVVDRTA